MAFGKQTQLIVRRGDDLSEAQIDQILSVSETTPWFRAIIQLIDNSRQEFIQLSPSRAIDNNALAMACDNGAFQALSGLLIDLEERRAKNAE